MTRTLVSLLACLVVAPAVAQPPPLNVAQPFRMLREYLELSDTQVAAIVQGIADYARFAFEKQQRMAQVQAEIADWTAKETLDPMALGLRYVEIEAICRQLRDRSADLEKANVALLTEPQKTKLAMLDEARKLAPVIAEAQAVRLLGSPFAAVQAIPASRISGDFSTISGAILGFPFPVGGCPAPVNIIRDPFPRGRVFGAGPGNQ